ncbi:hypothetical protein [Maricaulis parjimensis]|uniref:hypothetical protein n=1 Tax=Maricaulis parjimensis TaxID=144023 RepID=UPI001939D04C|nr:hypothetical protein [Maricaulis parjimensis]
MTRRYPWLTSVAVVLLVSASSAAQSVPTQPTGQPVPTQIDPTRLNTSNLQPLQAQTVQTATPSEPVAVQVNWDQARVDARVAAANSAQNFRPEVGLSRQVRTFPVPRNLDPERLAQTEVPILVPTYSALGFSREPLTMIFPRGDFYTLSITGEDVLVEVFCTRLAHAQPNTAISARRIRGSGPEGYRTEQTEYGREVSFTRYGIAYSITIECDDPEGDARCASPQYGRGLMDSLQILPGTRGSLGGP